MNKETKNRIEKIESRVDNIEKVIGIFSKEEEEKTPIVCSRCKHRWNTRSKTKYVSCPGCGTKVKNSKFEENSMYEKGHSPVDVLEEID